jgi:tryptophan synthase beta chain
MLLQDEMGQVTEAHSISAGLDYPGVGPEHAHLRDTGRARYEAVTDDDAISAFRELARLEGIIPALESAHAIAWLLSAEDGHPATDPGGAEHPTGGGSEDPTGFDVLCLSGRGDKDMAEVTGRLGDG